MEKYDVVVVGAGPAGLLCAETLSKESGLSIIILEKNDIVGDKVCAGGITRKDLSILPVPDEIIEYKVQKTALYSRKRKSETEAKQPFVFTLSRIALGNWQAERLKNTDVIIRKNAKVTEIKENSVIVNTSEKIGFKYLVGADGYLSIVRRYLGLPQEKRLIGIQYIVPQNDVDPRLVLYMNSKRFSAWYAWSFPHEKSFSIGCVADPRKMSSAKLKENFKIWLNEVSIDVSGAKYQSFPISYDYRGYKFGNIFLAGEAAGMASGFTGEGIYQSLVSGQTVARTILDENYQSEEFEAVLKYNKIQEKILNFLLKTGIFRSWIHELIIIAMNNKWVKAKIHKGFS